MKVEIIRFLEFQENEGILYRYNSLLECTLLKDIVYLKAEGMYSRVFFICGDEIENRLICRQIKKIEHQLKDKGFLRCHKSFIVNITKTDFFNSHSKSIFVQGSILPVSRRNLSKIFKYLLLKGIKDVNLKADSKK